MNTSPKFFNMCWIFKPDLWALNYIGLNKCKMWAISVVLIGLGDRLSDGSVGNENPNVIPWPHVKKPRDVVHVYSPSTAQAGRSKGERQWNLILVRDSVSETVDRSSYRPWVFLLTVGLQDTGSLLFKDTRLTFEYVFLRCWGRKAGNYEGATD